MKIKGAEKWAMNPLCLQKQDKERGESVNLIVFSLVVLSDTAEGKDKTKSTKLTKQ